MNACQVLRTMADTQLSSRKVSALESPSSSLSPGLSFWAPHSASLEFLGPERSGLGCSGCPAPSNKSLQPFLVWVKLAEGIIPPGPWFACPPSHRMVPCFHQPLALLEDECHQSTEIRPSSPGYGNHTRVETVLRVTLVASEYSFNFHMESSLSD